MHMQAQQISASNTSSFSDALKPPSSQVAISNSPATEISFGEWTISSPRLAAIREVSTNIAGELPAYQRYVEAQNAARGLDSPVYVLRGLSEVTPSELNIRDKVEEVLEKNLSLAA